MVGLTYTDANGRRHDLNTADAKDAIERLSRIPGYVDRSADELTASLGGGLRERRRQRAAAFASGIAANDMNPSSAAAGVGETTVLTVCAGNVVEDGTVVGMKLYDIKVENGRIVGTGGVREERFKLKTFKERCEEYTNWFSSFFSDWWANNWSSHKHW